jgi:predicted HTH transcriptional regulator
MSVYTAQISELQDLVERPAEKEWLELKSWVDLGTSDHLSRADIARHLAAISNYGGGYIIFGFEDDGTRSVRKENVRTAYSHDVFAAIIAKYLHPRFQCEVSFPEFAGVEHAVVWVPSHGATPVIARADGPQDKGVVQGIRHGTVYIRSPKPESIPASTPELWDKIIQRCVGQDETSWWG